MVALALNVPRLSSIYYQETDSYQETNDEVSKSQFSSFGEMLEENKRDVEDIVDQVKTNEEIEGKCILSYPAIRCLDVQKLLDPSFVHDHLCDVFIFIFLGDIKRQAFSKVFDISVTTFYQ